jgi:GT2 family glycosyltransferase
VIALTDADCTVDEGWLAALVAPLRDPSIGIAGGTILARRPATAIELYGESIHDHRRAIEVFRLPYVITMNWAARREVLDELGPFDETLPRCEDVSFSYRAGEAGYRLVYCPDAIVYHRNEATLVGLFREGWTHGYHGAAIERRHAAYIAKQKSRGAPPADGSPARPMFDVTFKLGKRLGWAAGHAFSRSR